MNPSRPYLIRAIHEWIVDNGLTPHLLVDVTVDGVHAPLEYADNNKLVLNINPPAVDGLVINNDHVAFQARFRGVAQEIWLPVHSVLAIYARENGRGMVFSDEDTDPRPPPGDGPEKEKSGRPTLKVVK